MSRASRTRTTCLALLASLLCAVALLAATGCSGLSGDALSKAQDALDAGGATESESDGADNATTSARTGNRPGSNVEIVDDRLFWGVDEELWAADITSSGKLRNMTPLIEFDEDVDLLAALGSDLYVCCYDGIWVMDLDEADDEATKVVDVSYAEDFWVMPDGIVYQDDDVLWHCSLDGGDALPLIDSVECFAILGERAYLVAEDGDLRTMGFDGDGDARVASPGDDCQLMVHDDVLYLVAEDKDVLYLNDDGSLGEVGLSHKVGDPDRVVFDGDRILYYAANESRYVHEGDSADEKLPSGTLFWGYQHCRIENGILFYTISGDEVVTLDLDSYDRVEYEVDGGSAKETSGNKDADKDEGSGGTSGGSGSSGSTTSSGRYDIAEGLEVHLTGGSAVLTTSHLSLVFDGQEVTDGLWVIEQTSDTSLTFSYSKAQDSGYDGFVFSLTAYDWGDNSYADLPNYRIGGMSADKKYVIELPTDVRYDVRSATQKTEYNRMLAFAESIDSNRNPSGNPLTILDS